MDLGLDGKIAIVTGGSKGIGRSTALALAQEGVDVAICARGVEDLNDAAADIRARTGRRVLAVRGDTGVAEDIRNLVATTVAELGGVDILINNAVNSTAAPFMELADEGLVEPHQRKGDGLRALCPGVHSPHAGAGRRAHNQHRRHGREVGQ